MPDPRLAELIQAELDGELTGSERAELGRLLLADPQARRLQGALRRTHAALTAVPDAEPPPGLRDEILRRAFPRSGDAASRPAGRGQGRAGPFRYAAIFAGGLLVASMAFYLSGPDGTGISPDDMAGTMAGGGAYGEPAGVATLEAGKSDARVRVFRSGGVTVLESTVSGVPGAVLEVSYDPETVRLTGVTGEAEGVDVRAGPGQLRLAGQDGTRRLYFESPGSVPVHLDVALRSATGERDSKRLTAAAGR